MNLSYKIFILIVFTMVQAAHADGNVKAKLTVESRFYPNSNIGTLEDGQSLELNIEAYQDFGRARGVLEFIARLDDQDSGRRILDARQAYISSEIAGFEIYVGNRQVFWGKAESANVVDVINQRDSAADQGNVGKLGAPSLSIESYGDYGDVQIWYLPNFREVTFNDATAHPSVGLPIKAARYQRPEGKYADDFALRFATVIDDLDLAGSFFHGTARTPILSLEDMGTALEPYYPEQRSFGLEVQYTGDATLLKWESLHGKQDGRKFSASVGGLEYTHYSVFDKVWDLGLIAEAQYDDRPQAAADQFYVAGLRLTFNDTQDTNLLLLISQDEAREQSLISFEASRRLNSWSSLDLGAKFFESKSSSSMFDSFDDDDVISIKLNMFF